MNRENLSDALDYIGDGMLKNAVEAEKKPRLSLKAAVVAAGIAAALCGTCAVAAVGGRFVEFKSLFGAVTGGKYVDATDDLSLKFAGFKNGQISVDFDIKKPDEAPYMTLKNGAQLDLLSYKVTDSSGNVVIDAEGDVMNSIAWSTTDGGEPFAYGTTGSPDAPVEYRIVGVEPGDVEIVHYYFDGETVNGQFDYDIYTGDLVKNGEKTYSIIEPGEDGSKGITIRIIEGYEDKTTGEVYYIATDEEQLGAGTYTLTVDSLVMRSKGDQPLEIDGDWETEFEIGEDVSGLFA